MKRKKQMDQPDIPIAPMIDCVFLMLVYFMTTSSLEKSEADLPCPVGQAGMAADPLPAVDEQRLTINAEGEVSWNGSLFGLLADPESGEMLAERMHRFRRSCIEARSEPSLRILPAPKTPHQALVSLLDAVTEAGIETVHLP